MKPRPLLAARLSFPLASAIAALLAASSAPAATYFWDNAPGVTGFGTALGTWSSPTDPALNSPAGTGWSTSANGAAATVIGSVTTTTADTLNFGSATALAAGTISVGTVSSGNIGFGTGANGIVLSGGTITLAAASTITVGNANTTQGIGSVLAGAGTSLTKAGGGTLVLSGANTYTGRTIVSGGRLFIHSIKNVGGAPNALGQPLLEDATIALGSTTALGGLTYLGTGDTTDRVINLAGTTGGAILDQSGTGLWKFTSPFTATGNGTKTLTLQGLTTGTGEIAGAIVDSTGPTALTKSGSATWVLSGANAYSGATVVNGGRLSLAFGTVSSDIIAPASTLALGGGTLELSGAGSQTLNGLSTTSNTSSRILLGAGQTLNLGMLTFAGGGSSLHFDTAAGGADAATSTVGTGIVVLAGQIPGEAIHPGYTVSDTGGFGLATVNGSDQVVRQTTGATLLPASGSSPSIDYRIDNNPGGGTADGSSSLTLTTTADARSLTVDTTTAAGVLTLDPGVEFYNSMWHFGGAGSNDYQINGGGGGAGILSLGFGDPISINNHNAAPVTFAAPLLANGSNAVNLNGDGTTVFSGSNTYTGRTTVNAGTLKVTGGTSVIGTLFVGAAAYLQEGGGTSVTLTGATEMNLGLAGNSSFTLEDGTFAVQTGSAAAANIGHGGDLTFTQTGGLFDFAPIGSNKLLNIGVTATGSATLNLSGGTFRTASDVPAYLGGRVKAVMNISGTALVDIPNLIFNRNLSVPHTATLNLGDGTPGSGTLKSASITKNSPAIHNISIFNFNGGTLQAGAPGTSFMSGLTAAHVMNGGAVIDTNTFDVTIAQPLLHFPGSTTDGLTKIGAGNLTLSGANTYGGDTTVSTGTLTLGNAADPLNANPGNDLSTVTIEPGAILDLTYAGTDKVKQLFLGVTAMPEGVYGKSGSVPPVIGIPEITGDGTLSVVPDFATWITRTFANGSIPLDQRGADDDFDNDGINNLIEYAIAGQDPTVGNPTISTFSAGTLGFTKRSEAIGLSYAIEESTDLGSGDDWTEVAGSSYLNHSSLISYTVPSGGPARNFFRLEVTVAP